MLFIESDTILLTLVMNLEIQGLTTLLALVPLRSWTLNKYMLQHKQHILPLDYTAKLHK
jgi:hypothetical protein